MSLESKDKHCIATASKDIKKFYLVLADRE